MHSLRSDSYGNVLSAGSSVWHEKCVFKNPEYKENIILEENIESAFPVEITGNLVLSAGYISILNSLTAKSDLIILAAGDINIKNIISSGFNLTLISTTGLISISELSGEPQLKLISKYGHFINGKAQVQSIPHLPPLKEMQIISMFH